MIDLNLTEAQPLEIDGWHLLVRPPESPNSAKAIIMNHGWTGDERSMWIFANQMPKDSWLIAPRAPYRSTSQEYGGFSWVADRTTGFSHFLEFEPAKELFVALLDVLSDQIDLDMNHFGLVGFSQGAAFNLAFAVDNPEKVSALVSLAGFAPEGLADRTKENPLSGKPVMIAHGLEDEVVPIAMARDSRRIIESAGGLVEYCESDTGHKLGANCFSDLRSFFAKTWTE